MFQYANNPSTTLSGTITAGATSLSVASGSLFPTLGKFTIIIDSEIMLVTGVSGTTWTVERGSEGTTAAAHTAGATVVGILTKDSFLNSHWIDVRAYGATGDGSTDDRAAIQAALDDAYSSDPDNPGATVFFPAGVYIIASALVIPAGSHNLRLLGEGRRSSVIENTGTGNAIEAAAGSPTMQNFQMESMGVVGNINSGIGLKIDGGNRFYIANCRFADHGTWGIQLGDNSSQVNRVTLVGVESINNYQTNATLGDGGSINLGQQSEQVWLFGCTLRGSTAGNPTINSIGLRIQAATNIVTIHGGDIVNHGRGVSIIGTDASPCTSVTIDGCYIEENDIGIRIAASGSNAEGVSNVIIRGNTFTAIQDAANTFSYGVYVGRSQHVRIDQNDFRNTAGGSVGIAIDSSAVALQIGQNAVMSDFAGTYVSVLAGTPAYYYTNRLMQTKRITTGSITAGSSVDVAVTWDAPFADTNYTVSVNVLHGSVSHDLLPQIEAVTTTGCTISVKNNNASDRTGTLHVIAIHD